MFSGFWHRIFHFLPASAIILVATVIPAHAQEDSSESRTSWLPVIGAGAGKLNFIGDAGYSRLNQPLQSNAGFQVEIQAHSDSRISLSAFLLSGTVEGEDRSANRNVNFHASLLNQGLMLRLNLYRNDNAGKFLRPFITGGIGYLFFKNKTDLKDKNGNYYYYWNDGTIRNLDQTDPNASSAVLLYRDYVYETDLRDANLDGYGKFSQSCLDIPAGAGVNFRISGRCSMDLSAVCHFLSSDYVDGITGSGEGGRTGNAKNDRYVYTSFSFRYDLAAAGASGRGHSSFISRDEVKNIDLNALVYEDSDQDGIPDLDDDSSATPANNKVYKNGKPLDTDNDGIPDYRDLEPNSAPDAVVTEEGKTITEEMIEEKFRRDSLAALPAIIEYVRSYDRLTQRNPGVELRATQEMASRQDKVPIPPIYRRLDTDQNGVITPREISVAIDEYMEKRTPYTVQQFFDLIDFFFSQH